MDKFEEVNIETFIKEVEKNPVIWEGGYTRPQKQRGWENVCAAIFGDLDIEDKDDYIAALAVKWKNIKDAFTRSAKKRMSAGGKSAPYVYEHLLGFLEIKCPEPDPDALPTPQKQSKIKFKRQKVEPKSPAAVDQDDEDEIAEYNYYGETSHQPLDVEVEVKRKRSSRIHDKSDDYDEEYLDPLAGVSLGDGKNDEDRCFFESIMPTVKQFDVEQKLEFRVEVLNLVKRIRFSKDDQ